MRKEIQEILTEIREIRRELHKIPEPNFREYKTSKFIFNYLSALNPTSVEKIAGTGVKAVFDIGAKKTIAFRADMDALPLNEDTGLPFASCNAGYMHACGHDAHMATALITALLVSKNIEKIKTNIVMLFQPSEEIEVGAKKMVEEGALENPHVDMIFGFHVWPGLESGKIGFVKGPMMAYATHFDITIHGENAHGAKPHLGNDAIVAAASLVNMMETIVSRRIDPMDSAVITIGSIQGGTQRSIICDEVKMLCTMRTFNDKSHDIGLNSIKGMLKAIEDGFGVTTDFEFASQEYLPVVNDCESYEIFRNAAGDYAIDAEKVCISEDFSFYQKTTKGCFAFLGLGDNVSALHTSTMYFEEEALIPMLETYMKILGI